MPVSNERYRDERDKGTLGHNEISREQLEVEWKVIAARCGSRGLAGHQDEDTTQGGRYREVRGGGIWTDCCPK